jgi:hypothetical protein
MKLLKFRQSSGLFFLIYTIYVTFSEGIFFNVYLILNLIFSLILLFNSLKSFRVIRKQIYQEMNSVNYRMYMTIALNILIFTFLFFDYAVGDKLRLALESFNPNKFYILTFSLQVNNFI